MPSLPLPPLPPGVRRAGRDEFPELAPPPPPPGTRVDYFSGLDLGQAQDFSALVVVERTRTPDPEGRGKPTDRFDVRHLWRWPLGTSYPQIVADTKAMFETEPLKGSSLVIDATGVGRGVVDYFRAGGVTGRLLPYTITAGEHGSGAGVPKKHLVAAVQVPLQERRLRFAEELPLTPVLVRELEMFRVKVTPNRNEVFESWRERDHDDMVLGLALALYVASFPTASWSLNGVAGGTL